MIKKLDCKNMETVAETPYFKLIRTSEKNKSNQKPLILINGQIEHHLQAIETATNITKPWCYQYSNYYLYDDEIHTPYIFLYDYPIYGVDRTKIDLKTFTDGLTSKLKELNLSNVDIIGESTGGMIGTLASKDERVDKVIAIHAPIYGTPLLKRKELKKHMSDMTIKDKALCGLIRLISDENFGYMKDNKKGFEHLEQVADLSKIILTTSNIIETPSKNLLANYIADTMYAYLGIETDGVVTFDKERMDKEGLNYVVEDGLSHFEIGTHKYTYPYYDKYLVKK